MNVFKCLKFISGKWELYKKGEVLIKNINYGGDFTYTEVIVDVYRKKRWNGMWKYKNVVKNL